MEWRFKIMDQAQVMPPLVAKQEDLRYKSSSVSVHEDSEVKTRQSRK